MNTIPGPSAVRRLLQILAPVMLLPALYARAQTPATEAAKDAPTGHNLRTIELRGEQVVVYHLHSADAAAAAKAFMQLTGGSNPQKDKSGPTVVVDDRTNSVLISGTAEQVLIAKQFLVELDNPVQAADRDAAIEKRLDQLEKQLQTLLSDLKTLREQLKPATQPDNKGNAGAISR